MLSLKLQKGRDIIVALLIFHMQSEYSIVCHLRWTAILRFNQRQMLLKLKIYFNFFFLISDKTAVIFTILTVDICVEQLVILVWYFLVVLQGLTH